MKIGEILNWLKSQHCGYTFTGEKDTEIVGFSSLASYRENTISWIRDADTYRKCGSPKHITCAVIQSGVTCGLDNVITTGNSKEVFFAILRQFWGEKIQEGSIGKGTVISEDADIDPTVSIGYNCSIVGGIVIGAHTVIEHNVVIQGRCWIGQNCRIQSNVVIGIDGYGYSQQADTKYKTMVEHFGGVKIGDDVFIGSHVNIARGTIDDTVIGNRVKIAPSTHIGHNNIIGDDTAIICSTLYGSVKTGQRSYISAGIVANQMTVGSDTVIGMGSVVTRPVGDGLIAYGMPAKPIKSNNSGL